MILVGAKKILVGFNLVGATNLVNFSNSRSPQTNILTYVLARFTHTRPIIHPSDHPNYYVPDSCVGFVLLPLGCEFSCSQTCGFSLIRIHPLASLSELRINFLRARCSFPFPFPDFMTACSTETSSPISPSIYIYMKL